MPFATYQLVSIEVMCLRCNIKVAWAGHEQCSRLGIIERQRNHIGVIKDRLELLDLLLSFASALLSLVHGINNHARYFTCGIMGRHNGIHKIALRGLLLCLCLWQVSKHPGRGTYSILLVRLACQAHNRYLKIPKEFRSFLERPTPYHLSFKQLGKARVRGYNNHVEVAPHDH